MGNLVAGWRMFDGECELEVAGDESRVVRLFDELGEELREVCCSRSEPVRGESVEIASGTLAHSVDSSRPSLTEGQGEARRELGRLLLRLFMRCGADACFLGGAVHSTE